MEGSKAFVQIAEHVLARVTRQKTFEQPLGEAWRSVAHEASMRGVTPSHIPSSTLRAS